MQRRIAGPLTVAMLSLWLPLAYAADAPGGASPAPDGAASRLLRTTLLVGDIDRAERFYQLLGFARVEEMSGPRDPAQTPFPLASRSHRFRLIVMATPRVDGGRIGLLAFADPPPPVTRPDRKRVGRGEAVLVVEVADAVTLHGTLVRAQAAVVESPQVFNSRTVGADGRPWQGRVFHVFDPDGNLVELLESARPQP